jgi:hypothetical protein
MRKQRALASVRTVSAVPPRPVPLGDSTGREVLLAAVADVGGIQFITVAANLPDERNSVLRVLQKMHATSRNLLFASENTAALQAAFDPAWESAVPYTVRLLPTGRSFTRNRALWTCWSCGELSWPTFRQATRVLISIGWGSRLIIGPSATTTRQPHAIDRALDRG